MKKKDPKIYDKNVSFFIDQKENQNEEKKLKREKEKPMFLRDYERKLIIERGGKLSDEGTFVYGICSLLHFKLELVLCLNASTCLSFTVSE